MLEGERRIAALEACLSGARSEAASWIAEQQAAHEEELALARRQRDNFERIAREQAEAKHALWLWRNEREPLLARVPALVEALHNWFEDVDEAESEEDLRLHDLQQRIGAMFLGYGGGHNHADDLRAALAKWEQA